MIFIELLDNLPIMQQDQADVEELAHYKSIRDTKAAYAVITLENIKDDIIERAKKVKACPHCGKSSMT